MQRKPWHEFLATVQTSGPFPRFKVGDKVARARWVAGAQEGVIDMVLGHDGKEFKYRVEFDYGQGAKISELFFESELTHPNSHLSYAAWHELSGAAYATGELPADDETRKKRKEAGQCEECGELLPMTRFGLGECPQHPKPAGPQ